MYDRLSSLQGFSVGFASPSLSSKYGSMTGALAIVYRGTRRISKGWTGVDLFLSLSRAR